MRDRSDPWKWPVCIGLTVAMFLATMFLLPQSWINAFFSPLSLADLQGRGQAPEWIVILPPPVQVVPDRLPETVPPPAEAVFPKTHRDPDWWTKRWRIQTVTGGAVSPSQAGQDSVAVLLAVLGVERDFMARARPDSVLGSRLFMMQVEDSFRFDELKPYLSAMARSRAYADILSRAADMYDDFLSTQIMTPD